MLCLLLLSVLLIVFREQGGKSNQNQSDLKLIPSKIYTNSDFTLFFINFFNNATILKIHMLFKI